MQIFWQKMQLAQYPFFRKWSQFFFTITIGHPIGNIFVLTPLQGGPRASCQGPFFAQNSALFYATPMKLLFFWLRQTRLNWMISPTYPEVTLDNFGFPVGGLLAAWQAVSWPQLPKEALLGSKNAVFGLKSIFCGQPKKSCYNLDGTPK